MPKPSAYLLINVSREQLRTLRDRADFFGLDESELITWAIEALTAGSTQMEVLKLLDEVDASRKAACRAIDDALAFVTESNRRIARMEAKTHVVH